MANHSTIQDDLSHEATESALNACYNSFDRKERYVGATCCATEDMVLYTQVTSSRFSDGAPVVKQFDRDGIAGTLLFRKGETFRCVTFRLGRSTSSLPRTMGMAIHVTYLVSS